MKYEDALKELQSIVTELQGEAFRFRRYDGKSEAGSRIIALCREQLRSSEEELGGLFA